MIKFYQWLITAAGLWLLKWGLAHRLKGDGAKWLQPFNSRVVVNREGWILDYCTGKSVFHLGFADAPFTAEKIADGTLLHTALLHVSSGLSGADADAAAVALYQQRTGDQKVKAATVEDLSAEELQSCQIILAGEILEHLLDPGSFIQQLNQKMKPGQELLVTVPNYVSFDSLAAVLHRTESIHPDHEWYFSPFTLARKFDTRYWTLKTLMPAAYGSRNRKQNFVKRSFPALSDCLIAVVQKR